MLATHNIQPITDLTKGKGATLQRWPHVPRQTDVDSGRNGHLQSAFVGARVLGRTAPRDRPGVRFEGHLWSCPHSCAFAHYSENS